MNGRAAQRGTALAETALAVGLTLLIVLNALQLGVMAFTQLHVDGAAYVVARLSALGLDATSAQNAAVNAFPPAIDSYGVSGSNGVTTAVTSHAAAGLVMLGADPTVTVRGAFVEAAAPAAGSAPGFSFAVPMSGTALANYFAPGTVGAPGPGPRHPIYLAQYIATGNGASNGPFKEIRDHQMCYAKTGFPSSYAQTQDAAQGGVYVVSASNPWVNFPAHSAEAAIAAWDAAGATVATC